MLHGLFIASLVGTLFQGVKDVVTPPVPAENWANKDLIHRDIMEGKSDQLLKNARKGKYIVTETYPEPHRDPVSKKIVIENCKLYHEDVKNYGAYQAQRWVKQGKYNLTPEELEKENKRIEEELEKLYGYRKYK